MNYRAEIDNLNKIKVLPHTEDGSQVGDKHLLYSDCVNRAGVSYHSMTLNLSPTLGHTDILR